MFGFLFEKGFRTSPPSEASLQYYTRFREQALPRSAFREALMINDSDKPDLTPFSTLAELLNWLFGLPFQVASYYMSANSFLSQDGFNIIAALVIAQSGQLKVRYFGVAKNPAKTLTLLCFVGCSGHWTILVS